LAPTSGVTKPSSSACITLDKPRQENQTAPAEKQEKLEIYPNDLRNKLNSNKDDKNQESTVTSSMQTSERATFSAPKFIARKANNNGNFTSFQHQSSKADANVTGGGSQCRGIFVRQNFPRGGFRPRFPPPFMRPPPPPFGPMMWVPPPHPRMRFNMRFPRIAYPPPMNYNGLPFSPSPIYGRASYFLPHQTHLEEEEDEDEDDERGERNETEAIHQEKAQSASLPPPPGTVSPPPPMSTLPTSYNLPPRIPFLPPTFNWRLWPRFPNTSGPYNNESGLTKNPEEAAETFLSRIRESVTTKEKEQSMSKQNELNESIEIVTFILNEVMVKVVKEEKDPDCEESLHFSLPEKTIQEEH
jgi:hypothetical protein